jgi:hypothetical protein
MTMQKFLARPAIVHVSDAVRISCQYHSFTFPRDDARVLAQRGHAGGGVKVRRKKAGVAIAAALGCAVLAAGCGSSSSSGGGSSSTDWSKATSTAAGGGMAALVKAAEKEGQLNVITLPSNWANYGTIMNDFGKKYHIHINDANPEGSSGQEITAVEQLEGQSRAPDVVDVGTPFAVEGANDHLWAPYKVATWSNIPGNAKDPNGDWSRCPACSTPSPSPRSWPSSSGP